MECFFKEIDVSTGTDLPFDTEKRYKCIQLWMHTVKGIDRNTDADTYTGMEIKRVRGRERKCLAPALAPRGGPQPSIIALATKNGERQRASRAGGCGGSTPKVPGSADLPPLAIVSN